MGEASAWTCQHRREGDAAGCQLCARDKRHVVAETLEVGAIRIRLDARAPGVVVPVRLRGRTDVCLSMAKGDPDDIVLGEVALTATLSFSRRARWSRRLRRRVTKLYPCTVPWAAIWDIEGSTHRSQPSRLSREYHLSRARHEVRLARIDLVAASGHWACTTDDPEAAWLDGVDHLLKAESHRAMARERVPTADKSGRYDASHFFREMRDRRRGVYGSATTATETRFSPPADPRLGDVEQAAVAAARELSRATWRTANGEPYPDGGWAMIHGSAIALAFDEWALAYGMEPSDIGQDIRELGEPVEAARAHFRALPLTEFAPEHFGHVHETLVGYGLVDGQVQPTDGRRKTGAHFTPPWLARKVTRRTVKPLLRVLEREHGFKQLGKRLLGLRICDPAVGAGAFLLAVVRCLAPIVYYQTAAPSLLAAKQLVAMHCARGVDKDRYAVFAAKLALTLECRPPDQQAFMERLEATVRHGDALVGLDREQIVSFGWKRGQPAIPAIERLYDEAVAAAAQLRGGDVAFLDQEAAQ